jgi:hypothetical protein
MKSFYSKTFAKYSPFFPILMTLILIYGFVLRKDVAIPTVMSTAEIDLLGRFGFSSNFINTHASIIFNIEFWISLLSILAAFFLGMSLLGKTCGLFVAAFLGLYPYYVANIYSEETITIFFFILFLFFQLQATINHSKLFSALSGGFFILALICNPTCLLLGVVTYAYQAIAARDIVVLYNFLLFVLGGLIIFIIYSIFSIFYPHNIEMFAAIGDTFVEFGRNFELFKSDMGGYIQNTIVPIFTEKLAHPVKYPMLSNSWSYLHYSAIISSILGILYAIIEEKARILAILSLIVILQSFFMPISFGFMFLFVILMGSYQIDKVFNDVFC